MEELLLKNWLKACKNFQIKLKLNSSNNKNDKNLRMWDKNVTNTALKLKRNIVIKFIWIKHFLSLI